VFEVRGAWRDLKGCPQRGTSAIHQLTKERVMAVAVELNFRGATLDQYDEVIQKMGLKQGGPTPPGAISHWVAKTDDGFRVIDVWESKEDFERFAQEQIGPYSREAGIEGEPEIKFYDVHNWLTKT
jgi:hypothetical protein